MTDLDALLATDGYSRVVTVDGPLVRSRSNFGSGATEFVTIPVADGGDYRGRVVLDVDDLPAGPDMVTAEDHRRRAVTILFDPAEVTYAN